MAGRPTKAGLDYFELDCHMEEKVRLIQAEFGLKGFAIVVKLYQKIYGGFGYYCEWTDDSLLLFMSENGVSSRDEKNLISEIVSACIRRNIFSEQLFNKFSILTSEGVQKRYLNATSRREIVELKKEYLLISVSENNKNVVINSIYAGRNSINVGRNSQSKGKESRGKENIEPPLSPLEGEKPHKQFIQPTIEEVVKYCLERKNGIDAQRFVDFYESKGWMIGKNKMKDWKAAVRTWEKAGKNEGKIEKRSAVNSFNNFTGRDYKDSDMDDLTRRLIKTI